MKERTPKHTAAVSTLEHLGYTYCGGEQWKPPLGQAPDFGLVNAQRARIAELEADRAEWIEVERLRMGKGKDA